ncbi:hypothetical protein CALCODRAFT_497920 [Calocera cornea HHB12733]|uniref:UvrC family homology region profile domain-containing protein n=1 Tax=Calocera cornea HHB12733 TaxID=1353952 RepID=A0A165F1L6_9BASI|nr:hypothetical protein CALCODRAFT_497920 [Calocera cornea HHB12733]
MDENLSPHGVLALDRSAGSILEQIRNMQRSRMSAHSAVGSSSSGHPPSRTRPANRYAIIRQAAATLLSRIPGSLPDVHKRQWGEALQTAINACEEPPNVNITFVGEIGAGKSKLQNVLLKTSATTVGRSSGVGTEHPTRIAYHDMDYISRKIELFNEDELKNTIKALLEDLWEYEDDGVDTQETIASIAMLLGRSLDISSLRNAKKLDHVIHQAPFFKYLGTTLDLTEDGDLIPMANYGTVADLDEDSGQITLPIKVETCLIRSEILLDGLAFMDSPGLGDINVIRAAGAKRAMKQSSIICIVAPIKRCDSNKILREIAGICQRQYLDGKQAQIVLVLSQCDHGLPQDGELGAAAKERAFAPEESAELKNLYNGILNLEQNRRSILQDIEVLQQELGRIATGGIGIGSMESDDPSAFVPQIQSHLVMLQSNLLQVEATLPSAKSNFVNRYAILRANSCKRKMRAVLQQWMPKMNSSEIPIFAVGAECHERLRLGGRDACHLNAQETEIPALEAYLKNLGEQHMRTYASRLERGIALTAERTINYFGSSGQGNIELKQALRGYFQTGMSENTLEVVLQAKLAQVLPASREWLPLLETGCMSAVVKAKERILREPEEIFKDVDGALLQQAAVMKATCRRNRRGVYVGIDFNEAIADIYLNCMRDHWDSVFFSIRKWFLEVFDCILDEVNKEIEKLDAMHYVGNEKIRTMMVDLGKTERQAFHHKMKIASYHIGDQMGAARQKLRRNLARHIQQNLEPEYSRIVGFRGRGYVLRCKELVVNTLVDPKREILESLQAFLINGLTQYFEQACGIVQEAVQVAIRDLTTAYMAVGSRVNEDDLQDMQARKAFYECAEAILKKFNKVDDGMPL